MSVEISCRYARLTAGDEAQATSREVPPVAAAAPGVLDYHDQWLGEQRRKTSNKSGSHCYRQG